MPPRHAYWTIILEGKPTAFRAHSDAELLPTFKQLQARHPDVVMKWFSRGRLWSSPAEEQAALAARRRERPEPRGRAWRPGGLHQDPRVRFKVPRDEKRRRFAERLRRDRREDAGSTAPPRPGGKPGDPARTRQQQWRGRHPGEGPGSKRPAGGDRWRRDRPPGGSKSPRGRGPGGGRRGGGGQGR
jgi:hypothetical protein